MNEINIKSSTVEKGLELAKEFLGKLISPTVEEVGLLISDNVKYLRFKNQVKILLRAKSFVEKKGISTKELPIKILLPLLDKASLEEDENLQDKWAKMLANMVDSNKNLQNQIFPYILSQISLEEYNGLQSMLPGENEDLNDRIKLEQLKTGKDYFRSNDFKTLIDRINDNSQHGFNVKLQEFELANLERLGLIRRTPPKIIIDEFRTGGEGLNSTAEWHQIDAEYDTEYYGYRITELGRKFLEICELYDQ